MVNIHQQHQFVHQTRLIRVWENSLRPDVTNPVSYVCVAAPISTFWAFNGLDELLEISFKFVFNLYTGKLTMFFFFNRLIIACTTTTTTAITIIYLTTLSSKGTSNTRSKYEREILVDG